MRRTVATFALVGAVALSLAACNGAPATKEAIQGPSPSSAAPSDNAYPTVTSDGAVDCGPGVNGLSVVALTTKGTDFCATALAVTNAYGDARKAQPKGDIPVTVNNIRWVCGERQGSPNSYQECASQNESAEKVRLYS
ncbi:hypothetical protein [Nocardia sp. NBC_01388]|uniref:hypothetical protein n=1 Tax=Nocardia sp. NBC_01388 TaxID=2903596 RepID=UPI00324742E9